jgi:predicted nucleic acid-binding protein
VDTSYLVALYVPNDHTAAALRHRGNETQAPILFSPLHRLELRTVVRQCVYGRLISEADCRRVLRHIDEDLEDGTLTHQPLNWIATLQRAESIAARRATAMACRSLDLWHVAAACEIEAEAFITFDDDQCALAKAEGLRAVIPGIERG